MNNSSPATADLCDKYVTSPSRLTVADPKHNLRDYGGKIKFHGLIETIRCFESNPLVRKTLAENGRGKVLVVDGGGSHRVAILGDQLAGMAAASQWEGLIINGCIRDSKVIRHTSVGVKALNTHPLKSVKTHMGERGLTVAFAGVEFVPGHYVYCDEDGIVLSERELTLETENPTFDHT